MATLLNMCVKKTFRSTRTYELNIYKKDYIDVLKVQTRLNHVHRTGIESVWFRFGSNIRGRAAKRKITF